MDKEQARRRGAELAAKWDINRIRAGLSGSVTLRVLNIAKNAPVNGVLTVSAAEAEEIRFATTAGEMLDAQKAAATDPAAPKRAMMKCDGFFVVQA